MVFFILLLFLVQTDINDEKINAKLFLNYIIGRGIRDVLLSMISILFSPFKSSLW